MDVTPETDITKSDSIGLRVEGDLGDLEITDVSDDDAKTCDKQNDTRILSPTKLPNSLVQTSGVPLFNSVSVSKSENVQFGNNTYFNGPVTIKQVIQKSGIANASYRKTDDESSADLDHKNKDNHPVKEHQILVWHKLTFSAICVTIIGGIIAIVLILQNKGENSTSMGPPDITTSSESSMNTLVAGFCDQNYQVLIISFISLLPLTFLLIYWSLTKTSVANKSLKQGRVHDDNCLGRSCINTEAEPLFIAPDHLRIVSRTDWLAQPVEGELTKLRQPVPWVIISHTATESCSIQSQCVLRVRLIQSFHIESRGWYDIGYNFLVGGDGSVYYGRGWDAEGAHTKYYNKYSIGIAFIGTFNNDPPPPQQVDACQKIIKQGVELGKLRKDYKLIAHRQLMSTLSPGDKVYDIIKEWPHFVSNLTNVSDILPKY